MSSKAQENSEIGTDVVLNRRGFVSLVGAAAVAALPFGDAFANNAKKASAMPPKPDVSKLPLPERGNFGGKIIVGSHQASAAAMLSKEPLMGLPREMSFFYGALRDKEGNLYEIVRNFPDWQMPMPTLFVQDNVNKDTLHAIPDVMKAAASTLDYEAEMVGDKAVWRSKPGVPGKPCEVTMSSDGSVTTWKEEGLLALRGKLLGPGLQWHAADRAGSELYVSQIYLMEGTYLGKPVRGIMAFDQSYLLQGMHMYSGKDPLFREKLHHRCWYTWGTVYKDGSYDCGHFVLGTDRLGFAVYTNEKQEVTMVTDPSGAITIDPKGTWPTRITIKAGHDDWEFLPDPRGRMPDMLGGAAQSWTPQNEGRWRRVGEKREPDVWFAWGEIAPVGRTDYVKVYRS